MPAEVLAGIFNFLADGKLVLTALAALAYVNSDCRQLARSCQFCDVNFNYSIRPSDLITRILVQISPSNNATSKLSPCIGACIRRITVATHPC